MSETLTKPEAQQERWLKYGANVVLASIIVVILAILVTWLAQRSNRRLDTTSQRLYSLKPQTLNIIRDNTQPIEIFALYQRAQPADVTDIDQKTDYAQPVADLLDEYERKGKN